MSTGTPGALPVLLVGEALVDVIVPAGGGAPRRVPGGSVANVAVTLARLGRRARLLTWTGPDADGRAVRDWLANAGVEVAEGSDAAVRTSVARATLGSDGQATYDFDITWSLPPDDLVGRAAMDAVHVHVGSIGAVLAPGASQVLAVLGAARDAGMTVSYDPNVRPAIMGDPASTLARVEEIVAQSDVVKVSDEDLTWLVPGEDAVAVAHRWAGLGPSLVVVTTGADGCVAVHDGATLVVPGVRTSVVDTVGAGDTFMGALVDGLSARGLLGHGRRGALADVGHGSLREVLGRCARAAAVTVSREGANPPTAQELDAV